MVSPAEMPAYFEPEILRGIPLLPHGGSAPLDGCQPGRLHSLSVRSPNHPGSSYPPQMGIGQGRPSEVEFLPNAGCMGFRMSHIEARPFPSSREGWEGVKGHTSRGP